MPRGKGIYDDEDRDGKSDEKADETKREDTPDVAETDQEPTG